ncbi:hypothetical protein NDU88_005053 [Pleurodeles waltl]|uniref:Uncharacterized protein n=1 Tax=Pleurodeles waltl TaxID=8319 RepID=A0AAV7MV96_PLEWA|nr:hypothetical protein NDU88_005053 [Pleurodeles waltl]
MAALLHTLKADAEALLPVLNRAHLLTSAPNRAGASPDILTWLHYYTEKEAILKATRTKTDLNFQGHTIQLFQDLSSITLRRHNFKPVTDKLRTMIIRYHSGHRFALLFTWDGKRAIRSLTKAKQLLEMTSLEHGTRPSQGETPRELPSDIHGPLRDLNCRPNPLQNQWHLYGDSPPWRSMKELA